MEAVPSTSSSLPPSAGAGMQMSDGAFLVLVDMKPGTEFGIDMNSWHTGEKFLGVKMIPPGVHFVYWSTVNREGNVAPRAGFFHRFSRGQLVAKRYNPHTEDVEDVSEEDAARMRQDLCNIDRGLGSYPYESWKKWISLTNRISDATLARLEPFSGMIRSVPELIPEAFVSHRSEKNESSDEVAQAAPNVEPMQEDPVVKKRMTQQEADEENLPKMSVRPGTEIRYSPFPSKYPDGCSPAEVTRHSMDSSFQLEAFMTRLDRLYGDQVSSSMSHRNTIDEILGELQFCFVCFLVAQQYDSFEHWKQLLRLLCSCDEAMAAHTDLYLAFINDLYFQIQEVPDDFFVDIVSQDNFLVTLLSRLFALAKSNPRVDPKLKSKASKFQASLSKKFHWDFDQDLEDDEPVVVELSDEQATFVS